LRLFLGGAAVYRCDNRLVSAPALAAEATTGAEHTFSENYSRSRLVLPVIFMLSRRKAGCQLTRNFA